MTNITRIEIQHKPGTCKLIDAYSDRLILEPDQIRYEYKPFMPGQKNPERSWSYRTNGTGYQARFRRLAEMIPETLSIPKGNPRLTDDSYKFTVTYSNRITIYEEFDAPAAKFREFFQLIKWLVPCCEQLPELMVTDRELEQCG